ncbi:alpha/beta hydrolase [Corallococcus terminator]
MTLNQAAKKWTKRRIFKTIWFSLAMVFCGWNWWTFQSRGLPDNTFDSSEGVTVTPSSDMITFQADSSGTKPEVIFFQGGLADPKAYAPLCRQLARNGYTCHLMKMDWRMPQYDYRKTLKLVDLKAGRYVVGGHSQGAKMAAQIVYERPDLFKGLFLMGTSHPRDIDLSSLTTPAMKIYAENDGLASVPEVMGNKDKLPRGARMVLIKGGNHSQFGYLGRLFMDSGAAISLEEQQQQTLSHVLEFLNGLPGGV